MVQINSNCTLAQIRYWSSLRASSPFGGYREKYTRERRRDCPSLSPSRLRRSLARSRAARFARPNWRACTQANIGLKVVTGFVFTFEKSANLRKRFAEQIH